MGKNTIIIEQPDPKYNVEHSRIPHIPSGKMWNKTYQLRPHILNLIPVKSLTYIFV